ncbi:MAG: hypothetical protein R3C59_10820 [Planctomycetaceae bacterium]
MMNVAEAFAAGATGTATATIVPVSDTKACVYDETTQQMTC